MRIAAVVALLATAGAMDVVQAFRPAGQAVQTADAQVLLNEARRLFDQLDYENAVRAIDGAIAIIEGRPAQDPSRKALAGAYEMRARSRFGLGDQNGARADFLALVKADPAHTLTGDISPRVVALFDEVVKANVTTLKLAVTPPNADVSLDGAAVAANATVPVVIGEHTVTARRIGYRPATQAVQAVGEKPAELTVALERVSAVLAIVTVPPEVEVVIDGISHGKTASGPPPADYAAAAARAGVPASQLSSVMVVADVAPGSHLVEFKRDCHVRTERRVLVDKPDDYTLDPVKLDRAVATLQVKSSQPGASVVIDGQQRGAAPFTMGDLCEGEHIVELRSASGRYFKRIDARTGQTIDLAAVLKPAFALVSTSGQASGLKTDLRLAIERAFEASQSVTIYAPAQDQLDQALKVQQLPPAWLAFDGSKRPIGVSADIGVAMRKDLSARLAKAFDAQGVASVTVPSNLDRGRLVVALLGAGSGEPDVLEVSLDNPESIAAAIAQLDRTLSFFRPSIGLVAVDVVDVAGAVVVSVDANGPAARAGIQPGDVLTKANAQPIGDALALAALLAGRKADDELQVEVKDRTGASKRADMKVVMTPRLIGIADQTLLVNRILLDLRARLLTPGDPIEEAVMRLNMAAALARVENWSEARTELQRIKLPDGPGVANGTVQYLLGLCADRLGMRSEAEAAWRAAAATDSLVTEDGPSVKELAEAKLAELQRRPRSQPQ